MTDSIYLSYSFAVTVWLSADCCQIGIIPEKEEILPQFLQYPEIYVSLQSQMNTVPIVQLVRASDCGSECRRFESDWAPSRKSLKSLNFRDFFFSIRIFDMR